MEPAEYRVRVRALDHVRPVDGVSYAVVPAEYLKPPSLVEEALGPRRPSGWVLAKAGGRGAGRGRPLLKGEEEDNAQHRKVRARVEHTFSRMKNYKILRDCRQRGDGLHHAVQAVARMHNLALAA